ncbi:hypothetical protein JHK87_047975 [Glycine soja]|nr:hypothetical protein JHK87_047975 [Glycine soja]
MAAVLWRSLPPKAKNLVVVGGLTTFVFGAYFYTMRVVGGTDELQLDSGEVDMHSDPQYSKMKESDHIIIANLNDEQKSPSITIMKQDTTGVTILQKVSIYGYIENQIIPKWQKREGG